MPAFHRMGVSALEQLHIGINDHFIDPGFRPVRLGFRTGSHDLGESLVGGDMEAVRLQRFRQRMGEVEFVRSEEHTSELQSLMRISYAVFCLKKKKYTQLNKSYNHVDIL